MLRSDGRVRMVYETDAPAKPIDNHRRNEAEHHRSQDVGGADNQVNGSNDCANCAEDHRYPEQYPNKHGSDDMKLLKRLLSAKLPSAIRL